VCVHERRPGTIAGIRRIQETAKTATGKACAEFLADFVYRTSYDDLPQEAVTMSRKMILDQLGGELASSTLDWNKNVLKYLLV
jgi:hypothetical protein